MDVTVRRLQAADFGNGYLESLSALAPVGLTPEEAVQTFQAICENSVYRFFVAIANGRVVGVASILIEQKFVLRAAKFGHIDEVAVAVECQGRGIGRRLIETLVEEAKKERCAKVRLDCREENVPFYEKCGFDRHEFMMQMDLAWVDV